MRRFCSSGEWRREWVRGCLWCRQTYLQMDHFTARTSAISLQQPLHPTTHVDSEAGRYEMNCATALVWVNSDGLIFIFFRQHWIRNNWKKNKSEVWSSGKTEQENETHIYRACEVRCNFGVKSQNLYLTGLQWHQQCHCFFFFLFALTYNWKQNPVTVIYCYGTPDTISVSRTV